MKYCVDCKYHDYGVIPAHLSDSGKQESKHWCIHPNLGRDIVTKEKNRTECSLLRKSYCCGREATWYEAKSED